MCGRSYGARSRLIEHAKSHSEEKKHKCTYCVKTFSRPHELQQHERVHTGHKPYSCPVCRKTFASYPNWTKHLTRAHAFGKDKIKQEREAMKRAPDADADADAAPEASPIKAESGIESAGSEISELYGFVESDDSDGSYGPIKKIKREINRYMHTTDLEKVTDLYPIETQSITETVNAVIDRIDAMDEDLDPITSPVGLLGAVDLNTSSTDFTAEFADVDDSSDIKAIVEHIDALSGGLEMPSAGQAPAADMVPYADIMPADNIMYNSGEYSAISYLLNHNKRSLINPYCKVDSIASRAILIIIK